MYRALKRRRRRASARGLATLEMVFWPADPPGDDGPDDPLRHGTGMEGPRADGIAAHAVWSSRSPRWGRVLPPAAVLADAEDHEPRQRPRRDDLDDPRVDQPVARGPTLPYGTTVNRDLFDPAGECRLAPRPCTRRCPLLRVLGDCQFRGVYANARRQMAVLAHGPVQQPAAAHPRDLRAGQGPSGLSTAYVQAVLAILRAPFRRDLFPLDRDDEFIGYSQRFVWHPGPPISIRDCHHFCDLDHAVAQQKVDELIDRIQGKKDPPPRVPSVAEVMTRAWINLYNRVINELQNQINGRPASVARPDRRHARRRSRTSRSRSTCSIRSFRPSSDVADSAY